MPPEFRWRIGGLVFLYLESLICVLQEFRVELLEIGQQLSECMTIEYYRSYCPLTHYGLLGIHALTSLSKRGISHRTLKGSRRTIMCRLLGIYSIVAFLRY